MIIGVGLDLTELSRMADILEGETGERFMHKVLTPSEMKLAEGKSAVRRVEFVAGRFAAKEAIAKAIGCGIGGTLGLQDMEVLPDTAGKPICTISEKAHAKLGWRPGDVVVHVSITHTERTAAAYAIAERVES